MALLDVLWDIFRKPRDVPITSSPQITGSAVRDVLQGFTNKIYIGDNIYKTIYEKDLRRFLEVNRVDRRRYIVDAHDCDDYSFELMGDVSSWNPAGAFGIVWGNRADGAAHAWNFFVSEAGKIKYVEPQDDGIFEPTSENVWLMII